MPVTDCIVAAKHLLADVSNDLVRRVLAAAVYPADGQRDTSTQPGTAHLIPYLAEYSVRRNAGQPLCISMAGDAAVSQAFRSVRRSPHCSAPTSAGQGCLSVSMSTPPGRSSVNVSLMITHLSTSNGNCTPHHSRPIFISAPPTTESTSLESPRAQVPTS